MIYKQGTLNSMEWNQSLYKIRSIWKLPGCVQLYNTACVWGGEEWGRLCHERSYSADGNVSITIDRLDLWYVGQVWRYIMIQRWGWGARLLQNIWNIIRILLNLALSIFSHLNIICLWSIKGYMCNVFLHNVNSLVVLFLLSSAYILW